LRREEERQSGNEEAERKERRQTGNDEMMRM